MALRTSRHAVTPPDGLSVEDSALRELGVPQVGAGLPQDQRGCGWRWSTLRVSALVPYPFPPKTKLCWGCGKLSCSLCKGWGHLSAEPVFCGQLDPTVGWDVLF